MRSGTIIATLCVATLFAGCGRENNADSFETKEATTAPGFQHYPATSGIIASRTTGMIDSETTVYFDENGAREATYTTSVMRFGRDSVISRSIEIRDGNWFYSYKEDEDEWVRWNAKDLGDFAGPSVPGVSGNPSATLMQDAMKGSADAKELPARTIVGREASGIEMEMMGMKMRMWMWENITLRSEVEMGNTPTITEVTSLQLGVPVSADRFRPPAGAKVVDAAMNR